MADRSKHASVELRLSWRSRDASHCERQFFERVNFWRDVFPANLAERLDAAELNEWVEQTVSAEELMLDFNPAEIRDIKRQYFRPDLVKVMNIKARVGRYYPRYFLHGVSGLFSSDRRPCRILDLDTDTMHIDFNHPLGRVSGRLAGRVVEILEYKQEHGGRCNDIAQDMTQNGPGMQARLAAQETDFFFEEAFQRMDPREDGVFYQQPRMLQHLDSQAAQQVTQIYDRLLQPGMQVLDLMSSWVSHLPVGLDIQLSGLGMNTDELSNNPRLNEYQRHDLNANPVLPYSDNSFDAVICAVSVEYLIQPITVFQQVQRVLKPGGRFIVVFSDRWFPTKCVYLWTELHPFERMGLVLAYFREAGGFNNLETESIRYYPRPLDDTHAKERAFSDPVFAVWGDKQSMA